MTEIDPAINAALEAVQTRADELRQSISHEEGDVGEVVRSGALLSRFVSDVEEAIRQVFTAGLSYPDPELGDELHALAERARRHGLPSAVGALESLEVWVRAIGDEKADETRRALASGAWQQTLALSSWLRLFKVEFDFLSVEGQLTVDASEAETKEETQYPTHSATIWPVGLELQPGGKLLIFCLDVESKELVVLRDHISEIPPMPMSGPVISRLFQDQVDLGQLMAGLVRLEDHPVVQAKGGLLFRPAFRAIPKRLGITEDYERPKLDAFDAAHPKDAPASTHLTVTASGDKLHFETPAPLALSALVRLNVTKLMTRETAARIDLDIVVRPTDDGLRLLAAHSEDDGRVFLADDPSLFRIAPQVLARSADETAMALEGQGVIGVYLRAAAYLFGGADDDAVTKLRTDLQAAKPAGLEEKYTLALARSLVGEPTASDEVESLVCDALELALRNRSDSLELDALGRVLGRPVSPADARYVDDEDGLLYCALWLVHETGLTEKLVDDVRKLVATRYSGKMGAVTVQSVCARALATQMLWRVDHPELDDNDGEGEEDAPASDALLFFDAHLGDIAGARGRRRRGRQQMPLPNLAELFMLADTWTTLHGGERHEISLAAMLLPRVELAQTCATALCRWRVKPNASAVQRAAEALLVVAAAELRSLLVLG